MTDNTEVEGEVSLQEQYDEAMQIGEGIRVVLITTMREMRKGLPVSNPATSSQGAYDALRNLLDLGKRQAATIDALKKRVGELEAKLEHYYGFSRAIKSVVNERERQVSKEGYSTEQDDTYAFGELSDAGACYALMAYQHRASPDRKKFWPWDITTWKPKKHRRNLVRGAALIIAEIEFFDRNTVEPNTRAVLNTKDGGAGQIERPRV